MRAPLAISLITVVIGAVPSNAQRETIVPVREFVKGQFYHGVPYRAAHAYGPAAIAELVEVLQNDELELQWPNALWVLGMIGDPSATRAMIDFLEKRFTGELSRPAFNAVLQVNQALGFLARDPASEAYRYLQEGSSPEVWPERVSWSFPSVSEHQRNLLLAQLAINGMGIAGHQTAMVDLNRVRASLTAERSLLEDNIVQSIELGRRVRELGYEAVFSGDFQGEP